ncbi:protease complex subunit PrcB family protein [Flavobacterium polysaccharolyticum]|uniref:Protease complex subunit PrcB family protein n=1 Tax=Flavobacterium polysaccharolyticum TaxID=3133148 RepID=A0ABU9NRL7_9FLAO
MKKIVLFIAIAMGITSCSLNSESDSISCGNTRNVAFKSFNTCNTLITETVASKAIIIDSQEKFNATFKPCTPPVAIDFTTTSLVGLFAGQKPSSGYDIKVQAVVETDCEVVVSFYEIVPKVGDVVTPVTTYPKDVISIPKTSKPVYLQRVGQNNEYAIIGSFRGACTGSACQEFYRLDVQKVLRFKDVVYGDYAMAKYGFTSLVYKDDYTSFIGGIPSEVSSLKGQTKTYGTPDSHDQGGIYFEWHQGTVVTKIYLDNDDTTDQNSAILSFKKRLQDKIATLKTKN